MSIRGGNAMVIRMGLDPSDYNAGLSKMSRSTELFSKRVQNVLGNIDFTSALGSSQSAPSSALENEASMLSAKIDALKSIEKQVSSSTVGMDLSAPLSRQISEELKSLEGFNKEADKIRDKMVRASTKANNSALLSSLSRDYTAVNKASIETAANLQRLQSVADAIGSQNIEFASTEGLADLDYSIKVLEADLRCLQDAQRAASQPSRTLGQRLRSIDSHVPGIRKTSEHIRNLGTHSRASNLDIGRMVRSLRNVALVSFGFRIAGAALGRLRSIVSEYISENETLQAQVNGLKQGMGQALAPAINLVTNAMSALMPYILGISNAIGQLMVALFGSGWTAAANGAKKTAAATGSAAKAQKEMNRQLMSFDEINKLSDNSSSDSGSGGGSGSNITPIESKTPAWLDRFKKSFSELFNSDEFKAANIGGKIGMVLQTGLDWLGSEGKAFDWSGVGTKLRENFDSFFTSGWWESLWKTSGIFAGGIADFLTGFFQPEWEELKRIYDENGTAAAAAFLAGMTVGLVVDAGDLILSGLGSFGEGLSEYYAEQGNESASGYWKGFSERAQQLRDYFRILWDTIVDWAKEKLGIHSPSTVFAAIGSLCMTGLGNGFSSGISWVLDKLRDLKDRVLSIADNLRDAFSFEWHMPSLKLPHLNVEWDPVDNVLANFFGVTAFPRLSVSWFAKGGILDGAQIFGRMGSTLLGGGEYGREAVLPLDHNTGWMDTLAQRVVSMLSGQTGGDMNLTIPVTLDGKEITRIVIKGLREYSRANGGLAF